MDAIERRVAWIAVTVAIAVAFAARSGFVFGDRLGGWGLFFNIVILGSLGAAAALLVLALVPETIRPFSLVLRGQLAYYAFALWALAVLVIAGFGIHGAVETYRHPTSFP